MNEKYDEPTIEQLRALLSGHPYLLKHVKTEKSIDRASREKLMELMDLCGLSIDQVDKSDPFGLLRGLKNKPGKDKTAGRSCINRLSQGHKEGPTYGQDADFVPFQITIEALGTKCITRLFSHMKCPVVSKRTKPVMTGILKNTPATAQSRF